MKNGGRMLNLGALAREYAAINNEISVRYRRSREPFRTAQELREQTAAWRESMCTITGMQYFPHLEPYYTAGTSDE